MAISNNKGRTFGSDVGQHAIKAAVFDPTSDPQIITNPRGGTSTRSMLYFGADNKWLVGDDAFEASFNDPINAIAGFKLKLGTGEKLLAGLTARGLTTQLIKCMIELIKEQTGNTPDSGVFTVPVSFTDVQTKDLQMACGDAGLSCTQIVTEPVAAAFAYKELRGIVHRGDKILVFDMGGGTTDVAACEVDGDILRVLSSDGVSNLGGAAIDRALMENVIVQLSELIKSDAARLLADPLFAMDLETRCTQAKISLGRLDAVKIPLSVEGDHHVIVVTREEFERAIKPLMQRALDSLDRVIATSGLSKSDLSSIYLVGGPCRLPFVQQQVAQHTGLMPRKEIDPEHAVAIGAALIAREMQVRKETEAKTGRALREPVREIARHAIGIAVDDQASPTSHMVNSVVIKKDTPVPCTCTAQYRLLHADQRDVSIEILQGENGALQTECTSIGRMELLGLPVEQARTDRILVTFAIDKNGLATVCARDLISGQETSCTVQLPK